MAEAKLAQQHILLPTGTTAERPTGSFGMIRANTTTNYIEYYSTEANDWIGIGAFAATGGTETQASGYNLHTFTSSGTFQVVSGAKNVEVLQVAGGGGGGSHVGGGAGAGGVVYNSSTPMNIGTYTVSVGAGGGGSYNPGGYGGMPNGSPGGNTSFTGLTTAVGGGMGTSHDYDQTIRNSGGSGGGSSFPSIYGTGTSGQGNRGGVGNGNTPWSTGGGGGASQRGQDRIDGSQSGYGGSGNYYSQFTHKGSPAGYFGGGGGGGNHDGNWQPSGYGGNGGGANGARTTGQAPSAVANTGGGGGGNGYPGGDPSTGGNGGSGIVIVRYVP